MKYYFVGIKGSGMAGLALIIKGLGHDVAGCDINKDLFTQRFLLENNIEIQDIENMDYSNSDIIVLGNAYLDKYSFNDNIFLCANCCGNNSGCCLSENHVINHCKLCFEDD